MPTTQEILEHRDLLQQLVDEGFCGLSDTLPKASVSSWLTKQKPSPRERL